MPLNFDAKIGLLSGYVRAFFHDGISMMMMILECEKVRRERPRSGFAASSSGSSN
jgi:hypothetical protein